MLQVPFSQLTQKMAGSSTDTKHSIQATNKAHEEVLLLHFKFQKGRSLTTDFFVSEEIETSFKNNEVKWQEALPAMLQMTK